MRCAPFISFHAIKESNNNNKDGKPNAVVVDNNDVSRLLTDSTVLRRFIKVAFTAALRSTEKAFQALSVSSSLACLSEITLKYC